MIEWPLIWADPPGAAREHSLSTEAPLEAKESGRDDEEGEEDEEGDEKGRNARLVIDFLSLACSRRHAG